MSALSPEPEADALFAGEPPSADEWRQMARSLAWVVASLECAAEPETGGPLSEKRLLGLTLAEIRELRR